jgi:predicted metal-binding protein
MTEICESCEAEVEELNEVAEKAMGVFPGPGTPRAPTYTLYVCDECYEERRNENAPIGR